MRNKLKKFKIVLVGALLLGVSVSAWAQKVSLDYKNTKLETVLISVKNQTKMGLVFSDQLLDISRLISIKVKNVDLEVALTKILSGTQMTYEIKNNKIYFIEKKTVDDSKKKVTGVVKDMAGEPIIGANVLQYNSKSNGTITDINGHFELEVPENTFLEITYIGYTAQKVAVKEHSFLSIVLQDDSKLLDEVVVIGYGTRKKGELTGAVSSVDSKVFEARSIINAPSALQGTMPGVTVIRNSGQPGMDNVEFQIRGYSSITGKPNPLIIVDGVAGDINTINPLDIKDITVLKDASASIYGARASDGVIIVTTKNGAKGKAKISYSGSVGMKIPHFLKKMTDTKQMLDMYIEAAQFNGYTAPSQYVVDKVYSGDTSVDESGSWLDFYGSNYPGFYGYVDWQKEILSTAIQQNHSVNISGGSENHTYMVSAGYNKDGGYFNYGPEHKSNRYNVRVNDQIKNLFNHRLDLDIRFGYDSRRTSTPNNDFPTLLGSLNRTWSFLPVYNPSGHFYRFEYTQNVAQQLEEGNYEEEGLDRFTFNTRADLRIVRGLKLVGQFGLKNERYDLKSVAPTFNRYSWDDTVNNIANNPNNMRTLDDKSRQATYNAYLEYTGTFVKKHNANIMFGASHEEYYWRRVRPWAANNASNEIWDYSLFNPTKLSEINVRGGHSQWAITSYFGRIGYDYDKKYMVDFTLRADGSSKYADSKRWSALFPAVSAAWNITDESFMKRQKVLDNLKLRVSWGQAGNQQVSGDFAYIPLVNLNTNVYPFGKTGTYHTGATSSFASTDRTWETIEKYNFGLDFSLFNSRLTGSFEYFLTYNNDMLVSDNLPALLGATPPTLNIGKLRTYGYDIMLSWKDKIADFRYGITLILSDNQNKLVSLKGTSTVSEGLNATREGYPINSFFGYVSGGVIRTEEELNAYKSKVINLPNNFGIGDMMYQDLDGDGKISAVGDNGGDLVYLGNKTPRYTYSANFDFSYKTFDLSLFFQGVGKRTEMRTGDLIAPFYYRHFQPLQYWYGKTWNPNNPSAPFPRIIQGNRGYDDLRNWNYQYYSNASHRLLNVAYLRLKNITLAYNLPTKWLNVIGLERVRIYCSGEDLLTFASDKATWNRSFDPEEGWNRDDDKTYPFAKVISFGIDVTF